MRPSLLILAAGLGSRYGGFKQVDPIGPGGEVIIDYSIFDALRAGFGKIVVLTQPKLEPMLREHFEQTLGPDRMPTFAFQNLDDLPAGFTLPADRQKPWGTAHAIWSARQELDVPFGVINADDFYGPASYQILHDALVNACPGEFCMVGFELAKTLSQHGSVSRGICQADAAGHLVNVTEHPVIEPDATHGARTQGEGGPSGQWQPISPQSIASMNLWGFDPSINAHLEAQFRDFLTANSANPKSEFYIPTAVDTLIRQGIAQCKVLRSPEQWFGMTYKEDRAAAADAIRALIAQGIYPASLRS
jgi:hypothetical protein